MDGKNSNFSLSTIWVLVVIGIVLIGVGAVLILFKNTGVDTLLDTQDILPFKATLESQLIAMLFWLVFIVLSGILWVFIFFPSLSLISTFVIASAFGLSAASILLFLVHLGGRSPNDASLQNEAFLIVGLSFSFLLGLMGLILKEVVRAIRF